MAQLLKLLEPVGVWIADYASFIAGFLIGAMVVTIYHRLVGLRNLLAAHEEVKLHQKNTITSLAQMVKVKLQGVNVDTKSKGFFKRLTKYFDQL